MVFEILAALNEAWSFDWFTDSATLSKSFLSSLCIPDWWKQLTILALGLGYPSTCKTRQLLHISYIHLVY